MARESAFDPIASTRTLWKTQMQAPATRPSAADKKTRSTRLRPSSRTSASLTVNPPLFPCLAEQTLREIEPFLCFCQLQLEALEATFNCLEPRCDVGR